MYKCQICTHVQMVAATKRGCRDSMYCALLGQSLESERKTDAVQSGVECADFAEDARQLDKWRHIFFSPDGKPLV